MSCEDQFREAEAEIKRLKLEIQQKDEKIAELEENVISLTKDTIETYNLTTEALKSVRPGRDAKRFIDESKRIIEGAEPEYRAFVALARIKAGLKMIKEAPAPALQTEAEEEDKSYEYTLRTRTENRGYALLDHMTRLGKTSLKSGEAKAILETIEGKPLDRKVVHRALDVVQTLTRGTKDRIGKVTRIIIPELKTKESRLNGNQPIFSIGGDGGTMPRTRKWDVPWDG